MTSPSPELAPKLPAAPALRTFAPALLVVLLCAAAAALAQAVGWVDAEVAPAVWSGLGAAVLAVALGSLAYLGVGRRSPVEGDPRLAAGRMQGLLGAAFLVKLAVLGAAFAVLHLADVKFAFLVAFALAFAGAALLLQLVTVVLLARALALGTRATPVPTR